MTSHGLRDAASELYHALVFEHGHDEKHAASWPGCLTAHIAMNSYQDAIADETCARCIEIRATPAIDLAMFWAPNRPSWTSKDGEIVRAMALEEHAKYGHPANLEFRR